MKLQNDDEEYEYGSFGLKVPTIILAASAAIFVVLAVVLLANGAGHKKKHPAAVHSENTESSEAENESTSGLTASDLNFWDMYQNNDDTLMDKELAQSTDRKDILEQREAQMRREEEEAAELAAKEAEENADPASDGKHTLVTHMDGTTEWITINSSIGLNNLDDTLFQSRNGILSYYINGKSSSKTGVDISQYSTNIDWTRLSGEVDYVMIRVGARGYDSGKIIADTRFMENVYGAYNAGIPFGIYFSSQAINEAEAQEEANYCLTQLGLATQNIINENLKAQTANNSTNNGNTTNSNTTNNTSNSNVPNNSTVTTDSNGNTVTTYKDGNGNTVSKWVYPNGNSVTSITNSEGKTLETTIVAADGNGNMVTSVLDENGNTVSTSSVPITQNSTSAAANTTGTNAGTTTAGNISTLGLNGKIISYPIAIDMHMVANDKSRIEALNMSDRTKVLTTFADTIKKSGNDSIICGTKEFLICQVNLAAMTNYEKWVVNEGTLPDYPYAISMWRYDTKGKLLKGVSGEYNVDISFIDYAAR